MSYAIEHEKWIKSHLSKRSDSRLDALKRGHGFGNQQFAEYIWWRLFGHFKGLHPEYEVLDWRGQPFYADFVWVIGLFRIVFEIQDFGSHVKNMDRSGYCRELNRGMFLQSLQYIIVYIPLDELKNNPELVLSMVRTIITPYLGYSEIEAHNPTYSKLERDLMFIAVRHNRVIRPAQAERDLGITSRTIRRYLNKLIQKGKFRAIPAGTSKRITSYEYIGSMTSLSSY